jgi:hypothetical protein
VHESDAGSAVCSVVMCTVLYCAVLLLQLVFAVKKDNVALNVTHCRTQRNMNCSSFVTVV